MSGDDPRGVGPVRQPTDLETSPTLNSRDGHFGAAPQEPIALLPAEPIAGEVLASRYALERVLGEGGMGKVWKGMHLGLGVPIAVKTLRPEVAQKPDYARRFRREAHAASLLNHANVVRVLDFGDHAGILYMVMEYLAGSPLSEVISQTRGVMPLAEVARVMNALCDACALAHAFGIVHRDLKPENVFLLASDGTVKVVDFGLAHVEDARDQGPTLTSNDVIAGTPEYMSPEQCRSLVVGPSADVYALGCILTAMLQRRPPFTGGSSIEVLAKQMFAQPLPLARPDDAEPVPPLLERLRLDLLAKAPEQRPDGMLAVKARLAEAMSQEATALRLPTRKGDEPLGDRVSRAPDWDAHREGAALDGTSPTVKHRAPGPQKRALLLRLTSDAGGVVEEVETGMAAVGLPLTAHRASIDVSDAIDAIDTRDASVGAIVLDGGGDSAETVKTLGAIRRRFPDLPVLVCATDIGTAAMNALVAAGASDVLRYPVSSDKLGRKLARLLRHGR